MTGENQDIIQHSQLKTANELSLYKQLKAAEQRITHLEATVLQLQGYLKKDGYKDDLSSSYSTDEAEFDDGARKKVDINKETEFILVKSKRTSKKRKASNFPETSPVIRLGTSKQGEQQRLNKEVREQPPPPIYAIGIKYHDLEKIIGPANTKVKITSQPHPEQFKINFIDHVEYRRLSNLLNENKIEWYTFTDKQNRPIRVMARGLHAETDPMSIKNDLLRMNLKIANVVNILGYRYSTNEKGRHRTSDVKVPLRLFELAFDRTRMLIKFMR